MIAKNHLLSTAPFAFLPVALANSHYPELFTRYIHFGNEAQIIVFFYSVLFGALLPDIDEPESRIGRMAPRFISEAIKAVFEHRGITHTLPFILLFLIASVMTVGYIKIVFFGIALGVMSHIIGDMLTKGGINNFFYPFTKNIKTALLPKCFRFYTNSLFERIIVTPVLFVSCFFVLGEFLKSFKEIGTFQIASKIVAGIEQIAASLIG